MPPDPAVLQDALNNFERYLQVDDFDPLFQAAIVHAQFELIHPFNDGNGRMGRILIPLFLFQRGTISKPYFYISEYLERNREEYILSLQNISKKGDWVGWIKFFLEAITSQATLNGNRVQKALSLYNSMKTEFQRTTRSQYSHLLLESLFQAPIFSIPSIAGIMHTNHQVKDSTTRSLINTLIAENLFSELVPASGRQAAVRRFDSLMDIIKLEE